MFKAKQKFTAVLVACVMMIASLVMAVATLVVAPQTAVAETTYSYTFAAKQFTANGTKTLNDVDWTLAGNGGNYWGYDATKGQQFGSSGAPYKNFTLTSAEFTNVSTIVINTSGATSISGSFTVTVGGTQVGSKTTLTKTATEYTFDGAGNSGAIEFSYTQTSSKAIYIKSIAVTYTEGASGGEDVAPQPKLTLTAEENKAYGQVGDDIQLNAVPEHFDEDTLFIAWESSNEEVALVDEDGVVTAVAMGKATITATATDDLGNELSKELEVKVFPAEAELTVAEALEVCAIAGDSNSPYTYSVTGNITAINTAYDSGYGNITVTIADNTGSIKAYRMEGGSDLVEGMNLTVTGNLVTYGTTPEFNQGCTYVLNLSSNQESIQEELNTIQSSMSLSYKYTEATEEVAVTSEVVDTLNNAFTGVSGTNYKAWEDKQDASNAVYAGNSAGGQSDYVSIQLRTTSNSGVVTTVSGGKATKISITFHTQTTAARILDVYGKNTAYTSVDELYNDDTKGTKIGSFTYTKGTEQMELTIEGDYEYIAFRSNSGALYLTSVEITWATGAGAGEGTTTQTVYKNSDFRFRFSVSDLLADFDGADGVEEWGIKVSTGDKEMHYTEDSEYWVESAGSFYVVISLGNIINDKAKLQTEFTVEAYVVVDGVELTSELSTTYSVVDMVAEYVDDMGIEDVEPL